MPFRPKSAARKAVKKAAKKTTPAPVKLSKSAIKKFVSEGRKDKAMDDEVERYLERSELDRDCAEFKEQITQLESENEELKKKVQELEATVAELEGRAEVATPSPMQTKWVRGKLPGEKYIKTDRATGKFVQIDKAEWDSLR